MWKSEMNRSNSATMIALGSCVACVLAVFVPGCNEFGGGAIVVPEVVILPAELGSSDVVDAADDGSSGSGTTSTVSGGVGLFKGKVVLTGTLPSLPLNLLHAKGAAVKDAIACSKEDVPDERLVVNTGNGNGVQNVFIYLARSPKGVKLDPLPTEPLTYDQISCRYEPHCLVVATGQPVKVLSDDEVPHNVHSYPLNSNPVNQVVSPKEREGKLQLLYGRSEKVPLAVKCDYHTWMIGYHLPVDHPFAVVSDENGEFEIPNLPAGDYEFVVWHESVGYVHRKFPVTVTSGEPKMHTVDFPADKLELQ